MVTGQKRHLVIFTKVNHALVFNSKQVKFLVNQTLISISMLGKHWKVVEYDNLDGVQVISELP